VSTGTDFPGKACTSILLSPIGVCKMDLYNISEFRSAYLSIGQLKCRTPPFHLYLCDVFDAVGNRSGVLGCTPPFRNRNRKFGTPNCRNQFPKNQCLENPFLKLQFSKM